MKCHIECLDQYYDTFGNIISENGNNSKKVTKRNEWKRNCHEREQ